MESSSKLIRCTVFSSSQETSEEFSQWFTGNTSQDGVYSANLNGHEFKVYSRWPNCPKGLPGAPASDVIIIRLKNEKEWYAIRDSIHEKNLILFKAVIWDDKIESVVEEIKPNMVALVAEKTNTEILEEILKAENELDTVLRSVFNNFDKSGDGFIDQPEIETMCRELGVDVTHTDFQETLRSLDVNQDNKISYEEFSDWWRKGRQCSKLMESLITMRLATSSFWNQVLNSKYLEFIKDKMDYINKEKRVLINSFLSVNIEKVKENPEVFISLDGYFGGEVKENISKAYVNNFEEGLKFYDNFITIEFKVKDKSKIDYLQKFLTSVTNSMRESFRNISRKVFSLLNNDISIKVIKKNDETICLSLKLRKVIKEELVTFENGIKAFLDDEITQRASVSFCLSGNIEKVKQNPTMTFIDSFDLAGSFQIKSEILKKNIKLLIKYLKPIPRFLKLWLNSYGGSNINLNFNLEYLKSFKNSLLTQQNQIIVEFLKNTLKDILKEYLASFGGYNQFKNFYNAVKEDYTIVINTSQIHVVTKLDISRLTELFEN